MASVGSLTVEIAANIASLRTGIEEANSRVASMEKQMARSSAKMQSSFEGSIAGIKSAWIAGAAAIYSSMAVIQKGWQLANAAAGYQEQSDILDGLATKYNTTAQSIVDSIQTATSGQVNKIEAMNIALSGLAKGLSPDKIIALANASEVLGDTVGETATQAFAKLSEAIITGRTKAILPYLGETAKLKIAHDENGKAIKDAMKSGDMYNLTIAKAASLQKELGDTSESTADKMAAFKADIDDLKLSIGQGLVAGGATAIATFELMAGAIFKVVEAKNRLVAIGLEGLPARKEDYDRAVSNAKLASEQADILFGKTKKNLELADRYWELMKGGSAAASGKPVSGMGKGIDTELASATANTNKEALASYKAMNDSKLRIADEISNREIAIVKATESDKLISMSKTYEIEKQQMLNKRAALESEVASLVKLKASNQDILKVKGDIALLDEQMKTKKQSFDIEYNQEKYKIQLSDMKTFNDNKLKLMDEASKREESIIKVTEDSKTNQFNRTFQLESVFLNDSLQSKASQIQAMLELENAYNDAVRTERLKSINETYDLEKALLETNRANLEAQIPALEQIKGSHDEILKVKNDIALLDEQLYTLEQSYITDVLDVQDSKLNDILSKYISLNEQAQGLMQNVANTAMMNAPGGGDVSNMIGAMSDLETLQANMDAQKEIYQKALDEIVGMDEKAQARRLAINTLSARNMAAIEKSVTLQKVNIAAMGFSAMAELARAFYDASGQQNEKAFRAYQALQMAQTVVSTAAGIMQIWSDSTAGPWYAKAALSAMVAATGAAQLATIASASPGSAATITTPGGSAPVVATTGTANTTATERQASKEVTVTINIMGNVLDKDAFAREIVPSIRKAISDNV